MTDFVFLFRNLAMILVAAFVLYGLRKRFKTALISFSLATPIWFAETRKALKAENPENALLKERSHKIIGFISILFPVFGAAMIQSDMNALDPVASERAID
jgi:hypothetical protein